MIESVIKMRNNAYWLAAVVALLVGCGGTPDREYLNTVRPDRSGTEENGKKASPRPATKTETIRVEGEPMEIALKLFDKPGYPLTTYFPEEFEVVTRSAHEGAAVWFYAAPNGQRNESVYIHFFFPSQDMTVDEMRESVLGERGLLDINQWDLMGEYDRVSYEWATTNISFSNGYHKRSDPSFPAITGRVLVGQVNGKAFRVTAHYPAEYADGFLPREGVILANVEPR